MRGVVIFVVLAIAQSSAFVVKSRSELANTLKSRSVPASDVSLNRMSLELHSRGQRLRKNITVLCR
jgi:hypothetical protein